MSFDEIIRMMENADSYIDLYDAASYIVDDDLRVDIERLIESCEDDNEPIDVAYSVVTSNLLDERVTELNESVGICLDTNENITIDDFISLLNDASNDRDLLNVLDRVNYSDNFDDELVSNIHTAFRNNRFMPLNQKIENIIKVVTNDTNHTDTKQESLTEAIEKDTAVDEPSMLDDEPITAKDTGGKYDEIVTTLNDREGQQFSVGDFNKLLQNLLGQANKLFLLTSDLSNMNLDETQVLEINDDENTYNVHYDIIDMDNGVIELKNADKVGAE